MSRIKATTRISDISNYACTLKPAVLNSYFFFCLFFFCILMNFLFCYVTFFYILTYEHGTRTEKYKKTERKTKHYTTQTNTQLHTYKKENKRNKNTVPSFLFT